ncbi:MAG: ABC transporter transmembrane domain-containing protein [Rhodanobacter sp.]
MTTPFKSTGSSTTLGSRHNAAETTPGESSRPRSGLHFRATRRLPAIRQSEASECGLACLAMITAYYGSPADLPNLRRRFSLSLKGVTLGRLIVMAQALELSSRPLRLELSELSQLQMPCILHWNLNHFVVLRAITRRGITIHDPALGERTIALSEASKHFSGIALELSKGPNFQRQKPPPPISLRTLAGSIHGLGRALTTIFLLALALELFALLTPQFMQMIVDQVLADGDHDLLTFLGLSFSLLLLLQTAISAMRTWTVMWLGTHFSLNWTGNVFQHLLRLPQEYFLKRHLGDVVSRFGAVDTIQHTLTTQFVGVILDGLMATLTLAVMAFYSLFLTALSTLTLLVYVGLRLLYYRVYQASNLNQIVASANQQSRFMESVRGVQTVRLYNQVPAQTARYLNATVETLNTSIAVQRLNLLFNSFSSLTSGAQRIGVLWVGAWLALKGGFSAGMLIAFVAYADQFIGRGASLVDYLIQLRLMRLQGERLADIVLTPPEPYTEGSYAGAAPEPSIAFENVSFRYAESNGMDSSSPTASRCQTEGANHTVNGEKESTHEA